MPDSKMTRFFSAPAASDVESIIIYLVRYQLLSYRRLFIAVPSKGWKEMIFLEFVFFAFPFNLLHIV